MHRFWPQLSCSLRDFSGIQCKISLRDPKALRNITPPRESTNAQRKTQGKHRRSDRSYRGQRGLSQGDIERRTGLLR